MVTVFGIRHHGPGSAKSLVKALNALKPDIVLIEGPPDAEKLVHHVENKGLVPPVALLVYNPKELSQASYFPFAKFSPEWQTMKYALKEAIPIRFMDLPMTMSFALDKSDAEKTQQELFQPTNDTEEGKEKEIDLVERAELAKRQDPLGHIARLAGYEDGERWWEVTFEHQEEQTDLFPVIIDLMGELRASLTIDEDRRTLQREAFMRKTIRQAIKEKFQNIAVICGAYHSPVLRDYKKFKVGADNAILKGIKKVTTKTTWVPWTYERLSTMSGYGAGVISPAWYKSLFNSRKNVIERWMTRVARLMRKEDLDASSAHVIEAVRLANTLATLRELPIPGIQEMREAAVTIFGGGYDESVQLIEQKLIIGESIGKVPDEVPVVPLQQDLEKQIKSTRLTKYKGVTEYQWLKATKDKPRGGLDIREPNDLLKSHLFHRLNILGINWGSKSESSGRGNAQGGFHEYWQLRWRVDFPLRIIEAGMWGNTVYNAATNFIKTKANDVDNLPELTALVEQALNADLGLAIPQLISHLQNLSAVTKDVTHLMDALVPLVNVVRYGNTRGTDVSAVEKVVDKLIPRIFIGLPPACSSIDEDATKKMFQRLNATNRAISILNKENFIDGWDTLLAQIAETENISALIAGGCSRILFDKGVIDTAKAGNHMSYSLSKGNDTKEAAEWIEGFLSGSGLLLIHNAGLWNILDAWINKLKMEDFQDILPLLRRTFSAFTPPERQKMMGLAKQGQVSEQTTVEDTITLDMKRAKEVLPTIQLLLGTT